ncbi:ABC transporter transmembrane domain-containing protein, partial [Oligoflexia bacterium]|nr:ABC transporter transmembrane domain-containing protein [Oligoflexia bacterium]
MSKNLTLFQNLRHICGYLKRTDVKATLLILPGVLALLASLLEGASMGLLIPAIKGVIKGDFGFMTEAPILKQIIQFLPAFITSSNLKLIVLLVGLIFLVTALKIIFYYFSSLLTLALVRRFSNNLRKLVYQRYLSFGKLFFDQNNYGHLHQILSSYADAVAGGLSSVQRAAYALCTLVVYLVILFCISWRLSLIVLAVFPVMHYALSWLIQKIKKTSHDFTNTFNVLCTNIANSLTTIPLVKAYTNEAQEQQRFSA